MLEFVKRIFRPKPKPLYRRQHVNPAHRAWTPAEDAKALALPTDPVTGFVLYGHSKALAARLGRSPAAVGKHRAALLKRR